MQLIPKETIKFHSINSQIRVDHNLDKNEIRNRIEDFSRKHSKLNYQAFRPAYIMLGTIKSEIQFNFCTVPNCCNFGMHSTPNDNFFDFPGTADQKTFTCKKPSVHVDGTTFPLVKSSSSPVSNAGIANTIRQLTLHDTPPPMELSIGNHENDCIYNGYSPHTSVDVFILRDKNKNKYQCKHCKRYTNSTITEFEPTRMLRRKDLTIQIINTLITQKKVRGAMSEFRSGSQPFYDHVDLFYKQCLNFLEIQESMFKDELQLNDINYISSDSLHVRLKHTRKKGHGGVEVHKKIPNPDLKIVNSVLNDSGYVLRSDMAFDFLVDSNEIAKKMIEGKDTHVRFYLRNYDNYNFLNPDSGFKMNTLNVKTLTESVSYMKSYFDGLPVGENYTNIAHHYKIKEMLGNRKLVFITDSSKSLVNSILRVHKDEVLKGDVLTFRVQINKGINKPEAAQECKNKQLKFNLMLNRINYKRNHRVSPTDLLNKIMLRDFGKIRNHHFDDSDEDRRKLTLFDYPLPKTDEGERKIAFASRLIEPEENIGNHFFNISSVGIEYYHNRLRATIGYLERTTPGAKGKSKGYATVARSPEMLHKIITIFRVCHNYHLDYGNSTPAMKIGIASKKYSLEDILFLKI